VDSGDEAYARSLSFGGAAYSGFTAGAHTASMPVIFKNYFGFNTFFNVQNVSSSPASVTVTYSNGSTEGPFTIQPGSARRYDQSNILIPFAGLVLGTFGIPTFANFSAHLIRPVICITTKSVTMEPIVIANPVKPLKKNAYEKSTR